MANKSLEDVQKALDSIASKSLIPRKPGESDYDFKIRVLTEMFKDTMNEMKGFKYKPFIIINYNSIWNALNK